MMTLFSLVVILLVSPQASIVSGRFRQDSRSQLGFVNAREIGGNLDAVKTPKEALLSCRRVARELLKQGSYSGLLAAVENCAIPRAFMVLDCPSGTGKTVAGIALRELDCARPNNLADESTGSFRVVHAVWPDAVESQALYQGILDEQSFEGVYADVLFERAKELLSRYPSGDSISPEIKPDIVWRYVLRFLFSEDDGDFKLDKFKQQTGLKGGRLIIFIDEVPTAIDDVQFIGKVRDMLKIVPGVVVILSGTNSRSAKMVGIASGAASRGDTAPYQPWSLLFTRLPRFSLELSGLSRTWDKIRRDSLFSPEDRTSIDVISAIRNSIVNRGNPWLISQAIATAEDLVVMNHEFPSFDKWQRSFSQSVLSAKCCIGPTAKWSSAYPKLVAQFNLLLEGSSTAELSDVFLGHHFAHRAVPDNGLAFGTDGPSVDLSSCAGWLYVSSERNKALDCSVFYHAGPHRRVLSHCIYNWQTTIFPTVREDILLYLGSCRSEGYFSIGRKQSLLFQYEAHEVALHMWSRNSISTINFHNPSAIVNSGSFLQVLLVAATMNAAALFSSYRAEIPEFVVALLKQLGICPGEPNTGALLASLSKDGALQGIQVPRCLFPGAEMPMRCSGTVGLVQRVANSDRYDLLVRIHFGESFDDETPGFIRMEAIDRLAVSNKEMASIASKLVRGIGEIGIVVVRTCCQYWDEDPLVDSNKQALLAALQSQENAQFLGKIYFLGCRGELSILNVGDQRGRLVVIKVPERSLRLN